MRLAPRSSTSTARSVRLGGRAVPIDRHGRMRLHFGRFPPDKIVSAAEVLGKAKRLKPDDFAGKTVIIGLSAEGTSDIAATPLAAEEYGPLIQAQAVDAMLRGGWLERPAWAGPGGMGGGGAAGAAGPGQCALRQALPDRPRPRCSSPCRSPAGWPSPTAACCSIRRDRCWSAAAPSPGSQWACSPWRGPTASGCARPWSRNGSSAAETEGELQAARAIQLGMVPPRARLQELDPRVDLDALLEPAKSVGGDFYDAMKIGDDRLGFAIADVTGKGVPAALFMAMSKALTSAALSRMQADPAAMADGDQCRAAQGQ